MSASPAFTLDMDPAMILAAAAELRENAIRDKTYQQTPIGRLAARYLRQLAFDNYAPKTIELREQILAHLALDLAHREPVDVGIEDLREHLSDRYAHVKPNTRAAAVSAVRVFFTWAHDNDHLPTNPARKLRGPRQTDTERISHPLATIRRLVIGCDIRRDRVALLLLYWCALRRNELRLIQWRHIDLGRRIITVFGKGGTVLEQNIPEQVAIEIERYIQDENPQPDEYLIYPTRVGRRGRYPLYVEAIIWEDRRRPMSTSAMDKWWRRRVEATGLAHFPMHEIRHSAGTHFHETGHDLVATQHFMRHRNPATTARTYVHLDRGQAIARVQRDMPDPLHPSTSDASE